MNSPVGPVVLMQGYGMGGEDVEGGSVGVVRFFVWAASGGDEVVVPLLPLALV